MEDGQGGARCRFPGTQHEGFAVLGLRVWGLPLAQCSALLVLKGEWRREYGYTSKGLNRDPDRDAQPQPPASTSKVFEGVLGPLGFGLQRERILNPKA